MKEKRDLPVWSVLLAIGAALGLVVVLFLKNGTGEASRDELIKIRQNQRSFSSSSPLAPPSTAGSNFRSR